MPGKSNRGLSRRRFLAHAGAGMALAAAGAAQGKEEMAAKPNVVFVFADQWRAQALGYNGNETVKTPNIDRLASQSVNFTNTISGCSVCCPYRASLLTGQYWLTHGIFMNDLCLRDKDDSIADAYNRTGYDTAYIGKWHLDGHGRSAFIPRERRQGFKFWKVLECTHDYNNSLYYGDDPEQKKWEGYDAIAQTREAQRYIREHGGDKPFFMVLSWGPPHAPYMTAPQRYRDMYKPEDIPLRPNVPADQAETARQELSGYYAHCTALDDCLAELLQTFDEEGIADNTLFVFTSDHGDMLRSQGSMKKQQPFEESIHVPMLMRYPKAFGREGREVDTLINTPDIMPTLLGICGIEPPKSVEGENYAPALLRGEAPECDAALITCPAPFGQWSRDRGGREYRGVRTRRYTYARDLNGPWLLFDNQEDPYQQHNRVDDPALGEVQQDLEQRLQALLEKTNDDFAPADVLLARYGIEVDETGTVPYAP